MSILPRETVIAGLEAARKIKEGHLPTNEDLSDAPILADWALGDSSNDLVRLVGWVTGHPLLDDGWITTSVLLAIDPERKWARTVSRLYRLDKPLGG
jgi:hypothetical protein